MHISCSKCLAWNLSSAFGSCDRQLAAKRYANTAFEQPYNRAAYIADVLLEARRWHTAEYEAVVGGLRADDLTVSRRGAQGIMYLELLCVTLERSMMPLACKLHVHLKHVLNSLLKELSI